MKRFNTTGNCVPKLNYMVDISDKMAKILKYIENGDYFTINRPRQYGKTTTLYAIQRVLLEKDDYLPIKISFEGISDVYFEKESAFCSIVLKEIGNEKIVKERGYSELFHSKIPYSTDLSLFFESITEILTTLNKKVVLFIDEIDHGTNFEIVLNFLKILRDKFLKAREDADVTFHSVILAGVSDIKRLKSKIRPDSTAQSNSPWNIAIDFNIDMNFNPKEIGTMLKEYVEATSTKMNIEEVSERIFFWTSGYPFLVSKICNIIDEEMDPTPYWDAETIEASVKILLKRTTTLFDYMIKYLENDPELCDFIQSLVLGVREYHYRNQSVIIEKAIFYGLIGRSENGMIKIHNKIFAEYITEYFIGNIETTREIPQILLPQTTYIKSDGRLNFEIVLLKFQEAIKDNFYKSKLDKSDEFLEADLRMMFMVFLKPILNGNGHSFKEVVTGAEKRLDVVVVFKDEKFVVELKIWHGQEAHEAGKQQLLSYMNLQSVNKGYMLIMSKNKNKEYKHEVQDGIFMVWI